MNAPELRNLEALEAARRHLDFEALAKDAPSVKSILFKAQTIVPLVPSKPWERLGKAGAALAVVLLLIFAPLVPSTVQLALVKIQFENTLTKDEAQRMLFNTARNLPAQLLVAAEFAVAPGQDEGQENGRLTLRLASLRLKPQKLADTALATIADATSGGLQPFATPSTAARIGRWQSIPTVLLRQFKQNEEDVSRFPASNALANDILDNAAMFERALQRHLAQDGYELQSLSFVEFAGPKTQAQSGSCLLPAWPRWVSLSIAGYDELPDLEQQELRTRAAQYLDALLLTRGGIVLTPEPTAALPVLLTVADRAGNLDPVATRIVQAEFGSLALANPPFGKFETESLVNAALVKVLDGLDYKVSYQQHTQFAPGQSSETFSATITINGKARQGLREFRMPDEANAPSAEF